MDIKITFTYLDRTIDILCNKKEEMNEMYKKFVSKLNDGSDITHYIYYYNGHKLGHNSTIGNNQYIGKSEKDINISVQKKNRFIKCPKCICNDSIIDLNNYLARFYGCKYKHKYMRVYDDYINSQKIDNSELRCCFIDCKHTHQNYILGFYKCLNCSNLTNSSKYYCHEHNSIHLKEYNDHISVKYDKKHYYCEEDEHFKIFKMYCFDHKQNLCEDCLNHHKNCRIKSYESMAPNIENLKKSLEIMENNIKSLRLIVDDIKYKLEGTLRIFKRYFYIAKDIIGKYELFNKDFKNYRILKSLKNLEFSNDKMNNDLKTIIKKKNTQEKVASIINIYEEKKKNIEKNQDENFDIKDNDDDWWEEIKENEKPKSSVPPTLEESKKRELKKSKGKRK